VKRHSTDLVGLLFGLALLMFASSVIGIELSDSNIHPAWAVAVGFVTLGAVALVATLVHRPQPAPQIEPAEEEE
jgi:hypothetical protein